MGMDVPRGLLHSPSIRCGKGDEGLTTESSEKGSRNILVLAFTKNEDKKELLYNRTHLHNVVETGSSHRAMFLDHVSNDAIDGKSVARMNKLILRIRITYLQGGMVDSLSCSVTLP